MSTSQPTVALAGATGNLGAPILNALLKANFQVVVLSRIGSLSGSKLLNSSLIIRKEVDYNSTSSLASALKGVDVVVSTLGTSSVKEQQPLIDAAVEAGVRRFIPSEFGSETENANSAKLPVYAGKIAIKRYVADKAKQNPNFSYSVLHNQAFLDWGMRVGFLLDVKNKKVKLYDGGDKPFSTTTLADVGQGVVGIVQNLDATKNKSLYIHSVVTTQNQLIDITNKLTGASRKDWEITEADTKETTRQSYEELKKPEPDFPKAMLGFLPIAVYGDGYGGVFDDEKSGGPGRVDNELLGVKVLDQQRLENVVRSVLKE